MLLFHPSESRLNRFADGELGAGGRARVAQHLLRCERCRRAVNMIRILGRDARNLPLPLLGVDVRTRVLSSAQAGAQVIVPIADPPRRVWPWPRVMQAGAGVLVVGVTLALLIDSRALRSEASSLEYQPRHPVAGSQVSVAYRATARLATHHRLRLRALYRRADDPDVRPVVEHEVAAWLERDSDGLFRGTFSLPPAAVYGMFAVEDDSGRVVDGRGRADWEFLAANGRKPSYNALLQKSYEASDRDLHVALDAVRKATEVDPERVEAWLARSSFELRAFGEAAYDSLRPFHLQQLRRLDDAMREQPVSPAIAAAMYFYAATWSETQTAAAWHRRILREMPRTPIAVQLQTIALLVSHSGSMEGEPDANGGALQALDSLEHLWRETTTPHVVLPQEAFKLALLAGRTDDARRWAERWLTLEPWARRTVAERALEFPGLEEYALTLLTAEAEAHREYDDATRPLFMTRRANQVRFDRERRDLFGLMGRALLRTGHVEAAHAYLDSATVEGWNVDSFEDLAAARLAAGDATGSAAMLARLAADPAYDAATVTPRALSLVDSSSWAGMVMQARQQLVMATLAAAESHTLDRRAEVVDSDGNKRELHDLVQGQVTIVAFFWPPCISCVDDLEALVHVPDHASAPTRVVLVAETTPSKADLERLRAQGIEAPVFTDFRRQAAEVIGVWGSPSYFVLDRQGTVRFANADPRDIPRQVEALGSEPIRF